MTFALTTKHHITTISPMSWTKTVMVTEAPPMVVWRFIRPIKGRAKIKPSFRHSSSSSGWSVFTGLVHSVWAGKNIPDWKGFLKTWWATSGKHRRYFSSHHFVKKAIALRHNSLFHPIASKRRFACLQISWSLRSSVAAQHKDQPRNIMSNYQWTMCNVQFISFHLFHSSLIILNCSLNFRILIIRRKGNVQWTMLHYFAVTFDFFPIENKILTISSDSEVMFLISSAFTCPLSFNNLSQ